jgi:predicted ester cyclase
MTDDDTRTVMEDYLGALLSGADFERFFAPDVVWTTMETGEEVRGREAVRDYIVAMHTQIFHASPELRSLTVGDGIAALEAVFIGTHAGDFAGIPPTGAEVRLPYVVVYDVEDDRITALRAYLGIAALIERVRSAAAAAV